MTEWDRCQRKYIERSDEVSRGTATFADFVHECTADEFQEAANQDLCTLGEDAIAIVQRFWSDETQIGKALKALIKDNLEAVAEEKGYQV